MFNLVIEEFTEIVMVKLAVSCIYNCYHCIYNSTFYVSNCLCYVTELAYS